jgi:spermidine synthase
VSAIPVLQRAPTSRANGVLNSPPQIPLALTFAFASGLTSLGYQVIWNRLLASGTGNSTYVFSMILSVFLVGLAFGALLYADFGTRIKDITGFLALTQLALAAFAIAGMAAINWHQTVFPSWATEYVPLRRGFAVLVIMVVLPATVVMGVAFPAASSLVADTRGRIATNSGLLLGANTLGSIGATFLIPFAVIPTIGSPATLAVLALVNVAVAVVIALQRPPTGRAGVFFRRRVITASLSVVVGGLILVGVGTSDLFVDPNVHLVRRLGGQIDASREDEIASVQAGQLKGEKRLWVTGNSMTLLTVDAKLMPILPLMLRPASTTMLIIAFGMGSAYRTALIAGLKSSAVEIVPSVPLMFGTFYPDAARVLADPRGRLIITDGRNYVELTDRRYDIIVVDPPPPVETAGVSVISSREFYAAARSRLNEGGVMMQWVPYGQTVDEFKAHVRTFRDVFRNVIVARGPGDNGYFMLGSDQALALELDHVRAFLERPGVLQDISSAFDSPERNEEGWARLLPTLVRLNGAQVSEFAGRGSLITDDRPLPEYFLLRHAFGRHSPLLSPESVTPKVQ